MDRKLYVTEIAEITDYETGERVAKELGIDFDENGFWIARFNNGEVKFIADGLFCEDAKYMPVDEFIAMIEK